MSPQSIYIERLEYSLWSTVLVTTSFYVQNTISTFEKGNGPKTSIGGLVYFPLLWFWAYHTVILYAYPLFQNNEELLLQVQLTSRWLFTFLAMTFDVLVLIFIYANYY